MKRSRWDNRNQMSPDAEYALSMIAFVVLLVGGALLISFVNAELNRAEGCSASGQWIVCEDARLKASEVEGVVSMEDGSDGRYYVKVRVDGGIVEVTVGVDRIDEALELLGGAR